MVRINVHCKILDFDCTGGHNIGTPHNIILIKNNECIGNIIFQYNIYLIRIHSLIQLRSEKYLL